MLAMMEPSVQFKSAILDEQVSSIQTSAIWHQSDCMRHLACFGEWGQSPLSLAELLKWARKQHHSSCSTHCFCITSNDQWQWHNGEEDGSWGWTTLSFDENQVTIAHNESINAKLLKNALRECHVRHPQYNTSYAPRCAASVHTFMSNMLYLHALGLGLGSLLICRSNVRNKMI